MFKPKARSHRSISKSITIQTIDVPNNHSHFRTIIFNISGLKFEIPFYKLLRHPDTLIGDLKRCERYLDRHSNEYFFDRHRPTFEAIFLYYQLDTPLKRPFSVPDEIFLEEITFFQIEQVVIDQYKKEEGYVEEIYDLPKNKYKRKLWTLFEYPQTGLQAYCVGLLSMMFTVISIILFCVETLPVFRETHCVDGSAPNFLDPFFVIETLCTLWFTLEIMVRFSVCPSKRNYVKDFKNTVDVVAILPYYITLVNVLYFFNCSGAKSSASLAFLRVIKLIRVFKLTKHSSGLQVLLKTFRASIGSLGLFVVALSLLVILFSTALYYVENTYKETDIKSIPHAFWWAIITMCTVGYGDDVPRNILGKIIGSVCAVTGVLTLAIPVPIITENFNKLYSHRTSRTKM